MGFLPPEGKGDVGMVRSDPDSELTSYTSIWPGVCLFVATNKNPTLSVPQAVNKVATASALAVTRPTWPTLPNFMRFLRESLVAFSRSAETPVWMLCRKDRG